MPGEERLTSLASRVRVADDVLFRELEGEAVLLHLDTGLYYGLDEVGTRMWRALAETGTVRAACARLLLEYEVAREDLERDLLRLAEELATRRLLEVVAEDASEGPAAARDE